MIYTNNDLIDSIEGSGQRIKRANNYLNKEHDHAYCCFRYSFHWQKYIN